MMAKKYWVLWAALLLSGTLVAQTHKHVAVDPAVVQKMGVRTAKVSRQALSRDIRAVGIVEVPEDQVATVNLRFSGWVEKLFADETGVYINKGAPLFQVYSPELVSAQEEFLLGLKTEGLYGSLTKNARAKLGYLGLSNADILQIQKSRRAKRALTIHAPKAGHILEKNIIQGARIGAGKDLYKIGDLSTVWVSTSIYDFDAPWVAKGNTASMVLSYQKGKKYSGKVAFIHPTLNPKSRTLSVRLEFENKDLGLKPGMFATVRINTKAKEDILSIPSEAVLHSGDGEHVFVATGGGHFELRNIRSGFSAGARTEILSGLVEHETVVTSGQFMLDSESQLQEAAQKFLSTQTNSSKTEKKSGGEEVYWTCPMHPDIVKDASGQCPICGMNLVQKKIKR